MSFRDMSSQEMLATTRPWVNAGHHAHTILMDRPITAAMMPEVIRCHELLERVLYPGVEGVLEELIKQSVSKDARHDNLVRSIDARLSAEIMCATSAAEAAPFIRLRTLLLPDGLALVQKSYAHEVGHAESVASQLTPADRALLQTIPMVNGTLDDLVTEYLTTAEELGDIEHQRRILGDARPGKGEMLQTRNHWIRAVSLVIAAAEVLGTQDTEVQELMHAVERAKQQAAIRRKQRAARSNDEEGDIFDDDLQDEIVPSPEPDLPEAAEPDVAEPEAFTV